jgi:hypothetical protein
MSRKIRLAAALLMVSSLTSGSLNAFPLAHSPVFADRGTGSLTTLVNWIGSFSSGAKPHGKVPKPVRSKIASQLDPDGNH